MKCGMTLKRCAEVCKRSQCGDSTINIPPVFCCPLAKYLFKWNSGEGEIGWMIVVVLVYLKCANLNEKNPFHKKREKKTKLSYINFQAHTHTHPHKHLPCTRGQNQLITFHWLCYSIFYRLTRNSIVSAKIRFHLCFYFGFVSKCKIRIKTAAFWNQKS